ncbi:MAG: uroporphyrinogen-III synthase, partial [Planctomycetota bacterium]|nr:uroporphyrinogen-III synthase [Planctomycetota bacterium]
MNPPPQPLASPTPIETGNGLSRLRVCAFESRKGADLRALIERMGGIATIAPSMREIPLTDNPLALAFGERLLAGNIDVMVFLTGVGARALADVLQTQYALPDVIAALNQRVIVVRGPKPAVVLREWGVKIDVQVPEPNTWRDLLRAVEHAIPLAGKLIAVQEYGIPNEDLYAGLRALGGTVLPVPVYRWELP